MHSRIIELSTEPICVDERICESDYYDNGFIGAIADYVSENTDRNHDIEWFVSYLKSKNVVSKSNEESFTLSDNFREKYFKEKYDALKECVSNMSFETFCKNSLDLYRVTSYIEDKYEFYIHHDGYYETLDSFMRNANDGQTWYFGGTLDYHF